MTMPRRIDRESSSKMRDSGSLEYASTRNYLETAGAASPRLGRDRRDAESNLGDPACFRRSST